MRGTLSGLLFVLVLTVCGLGQSEETQWVAAVAHTPGVQGTWWQTDVAVLNRCDADATVELRLHHGDGVVDSNTYAVPSGKQQIFQDVVAQLTSGDAAGALEVISDVEVGITSRTYNTSGDGSFGQSLDGIDPEDGMVAGEVVVLQQLREDEAFRTNIGVVNMGEHAASVSVALWDRNGSYVGGFAVFLEPGQFAQDNRPYRHRFNRTDIVGGYADVTVNSGDGIFAYASVVDDVTGDPTTVAGRPGPSCPPNIADQLAAIPGMAVEERESSVEGYRFFVLQYEQPADHADPAAGNFSQFLTLYHRDHQAPMIFGTLGYMNSVNLYNSELTAMLGANQLFAEHRFFGGSRPDPTDWSLLTIEQAAADHHRLVEAFKSIYGSTWISTGFSKGGMTAVYHRRFYPDDVYATVPYVAPIMFGAPDQRFLDVVANLGAPDCRDALITAQREALIRREQMADLIEQNYPQLTYDRMGLDAAMDVTVLETPFSFWMVLGEDFCSEIPAADAGDQEIFDFIDSTGGWISYSDPIVEIYEPYVYQAYSQTGYAAIAEEHLEDLLLSGPDREDVSLPPGEDPVFDPEVMPDIAQWVAAGGERLLFLYGENDPWTGGAYELGQAVDSYQFFDPGGTHGTFIATLEPDDQAEVMEILQRWTGVAPNPPIAVEGGVKGRRYWQLPPEVLKVAE